MRKRFGKQSCFFQLHCCLCESMRMYLFVKLVLLGLPVGECPIYVQICEATIQFVLKKSVRILLSVFHYPEMLLDFVFEFQQRLHPHECLALLDARPVLGSFITIETGPPLGTFEKVEHFEEISELVFSEDFENSMENSPT